MRKNLNDLLPETEQIKHVVFDQEQARAKFDHVARYYFWIMGALEIKPNMHALAMANIKEGEKVLDVGIGTGWVLERIVPLVGTKNITYGVDFSVGMKKVALNNLKKRGYDLSVELTTACAQDMPYVDNFFDVVFASFIIDLLPVQEISKTLKEIYRVLKPGGRLIVVSMTKNGTGVHRCARYLYEWMYDKWPTIGGYRVSCRPIYIENDVLRAGFFVKNYKLTSITGFLFPIALIDARKHA